MKHDRIEPHHTDTPIPRLSDEEIEARVFRNLEARQKVWEEEWEGSVIILQYPDTRNIFQRLSAWWHLRFQYRNGAEPLDEDATVKEPVWPRHWGTSKYL